jgi:aspartyl/asparaginyl beta-hydroxylase (cupin superfamily)
MTINPAADRTLGELVEAADRAMQAGRLEEAARGWETVLSLASGHPWALLHLGQHALYCGQPQRAEELLQKAAQADPGNPVVSLNLSFVFRALGDTAREMAALIRALTIDPYFLPALLARGALLERSGNPRQAAKIYKDVLTIVPSGARVEPWLAEPLAHARAMVESNRADLAAHLKTRLGAALASHPEADLSRFEEARDVMIGARKAYLSQPTLLHYPRLPAIPFYPREEFPWLEAVEKATPVIQQELAALLAAGGGDFSPYVDHPDGVPLNQWADLNRSADWSAYFLLKEGRRISDHAMHCPRTAALLETLPLADIPGIAPAAFFSLLKPRTLIPPHTGVTNTRLVVHIPLVVPEGCWFRVGNEKREWRIGEALIFDDSIEHEAWNGSDEPRYLLIFDIWNPLLSPAERELVGALLVGFEEYYGRQNDQVQASQA